MIEEIPLVSEFVNLLFPSECVVCGNGLVHGEKVMCTRCLYKFPRTNFHIETENKTSELFVGRVPYVWAGSLFYYNKHSRYARLIHELKYNGRTDIGTYLGTMLGHELIRAGIGS